MDKEQKNAVVLFSGGLDSTTCLALAKQQGYQVYALSFNYHQQHQIELAAAQQVAQAIGVKKHLVLNIDLQKIGGSALTSDMQIPKDELDSDQDEIPVTYVPARNTIFLSLALAWAEVLRAEHIFIGVNSLDYSGYPDCRPEFIQAFQKMANLATKECVQGQMQIKINTPLIKLTKAQIIAKGLQLGIDYSLTLSCYDPTEDGLACGYCDSCLLRKKGFWQAGIADPTKYNNSSSSVDHNEQ